MEGFNIEYKVDEFSKNVQSISLSFFNVEENIDYNVKLIGDCKRKSKSEIFEKSIILRKNNLGKRKKNN